MRDIKPDKIKVEMFCVKWNFPFCGEFSTKNCLPPVIVWHFPGQIKFYLDFWKVSFEKGTDTIEEQRASGKNREQFPFNCLKLNCTINWARSWSRIVISWELGHYLGLGLAAGYNINYFLTCNFLKLSQIEVDKIQDLSCPSLKRFTQFKERRGH